MMPILISPCRSFSSFPFLSLITSLFNAPSIWHGPFGQFDETIKPIWKRSDFRHAYIQTSWQDCLEAVKGGKKGAINKMWRLGNVSEITTTAAAVCLWVSLNCILHGLLVRRRRICGRLNCSALGTQCSSFLPHKAPMSKYVFGSSYCCHMSWQKRVQTTSNGIQ